MEVAPNIGYYQMLFKVPDHPIENGEFLFIQFLFDSLRSELSSFLSFSDRIADCLSCVLHCNENGATWAVARSVAGPDDQL